MVSHQDLIIFLHIPKTAGATLHDIVNRQYKSGAVFDLYSPEDLARYLTLPESAKRAIRIIQGHHSFGLHTMFPDATYFTVLREPVNRVISFYYYSAQIPDQYFGKIILEKKWNLEQSILNEATLELNNLQTRMIAGNEPVPYGEDSQEMLETAKRNLREHFAVVGLTERFDESLLLMRQAFGWKMPVYTRKNVTKKRPSQENISSGTLETIKAYNALDIELYKYAENLFEAQWQRAGRSIQLESKVFQALNAALNALYTRYQGTVLQQARVWLHQHFGI